MSRRNKQPIDLCPGNARGRRKLKRYKAREKRKLYGQLYTEGFSVSGRALRAARRFAQQFMRPCVVATPASVPERQMLDFAGVELRVANNFLQQAEAAHRMQPEMKRKLKESMAEQGFEAVAEVDDSIVFSRAVDAPIRGHTVTHAFIDDANFTDLEMDDVKIASGMEAIARKHGMRDEDIRTIQERFLKAYPQLKALAQQLKEKK